MYLDTLVKNALPHHYHPRAGKTAPRSSTLSRTELRRIVAEMIG